MKKIKKKKPTHKRAEENQSAIFLIIPDGTAPASQGYQARLAGMNEFRAGLITWLERSGLMSGVKEVSPATAAAGIFITCTEAVRKQLSGAPHVKSVAVPATMGLVD